jgi:uncharacterized protein (UPF0332 family)
VSEQTATLLARAETELKAARLLADGGFPDQAASRAYYAAFFAAEAALLALGETRSKHSGVIAAFGRLVVKEEGFNPELWGDLRRLFELRNAADYSWLDEPQTASDDPVAIAERLVAALASWIDSQAR